MRKNGYYGVGIVNGKTEFNYWSLFRTAQILDAYFLFTIGERYKIHAADTMKSYRHMPVFNYKDFDDFNNHRPYDCVLVGVETGENSTILDEFDHPKRAIYLLGAEDNGLPKKAIEKCQYLVKLHGDRSMNVSVAGSIVLHDRFSNKINKTSRVGE